MATVYKGLGEICVKIAYCGAGDSGKATSLADLHGRVEAEPGTKSELVSLSSSPDYSVRTELFTFVPQGIPLIGGLKVKLQVFALTKLIGYSKPYELMVSDADGIVFVVDSRSEKMHSNKQCLQTVETALGRAN